MENRQRLSPMGQEMLNTLTAYHAGRIAEFEAQSSRQKQRNDKRLPARLDRMLAMMGSTGLEGAEAEFAAETAKFAPELPQIGGADFSVKGHRHRVYLPFEFLGRDLNVASGSAGGYLVGLDVASPQDILRPVSLAIAAGISVLPGLQGTTTLPHTSATSSVQWMANEGSAASASDPTLAAATLSPKIAIATFNWSHRFAKSASDPEGWARRELLRTAGQVVDQAVLQGAGSSGEPTGLVNTANVGVQSGTSLANSGVLAMKGNAGTANVQEGSIAFIGTPAVRQLLEGRERAAGNGYVWERGVVAGCPAFASTEMPSGSLICGPMNQVWLGMWGGLIVESNPYGDRNNLNFFRQGLVMWRVVLAVDVGLSCPAAAFTLASSVT
jgi:HK97 family phage major capsid protein